MWVIQWRNDVYVNRRQGERGEGRRSVKREGGDIVD